MKNKMFKLMLERKKKGLTQKELGDKAGVKAITIWSYENGERVPKADILKKLATVLECSIDDIV